MTTQPEKKENAEPQVSRDELSEHELAKASGGFHITKMVDKASPNLFLNCATGSSPKQVP